MNEGNNFSIEASQPLADLSPNKLSTAHPIQQLQTKPIAQPEGTSKPEGAQNFQSILKAMAEHGEQLQQQLHKMQNQDLSEPEGLDEAFNEANSAMKSNQSAARNLQQWLELQHWNLG